MEDAREKRVPDIAFQMCAFYRVWCLVELNAALGGRKPVVMLIGTADPATGAFRNPYDRGCARNAADRLFPPHLDDHGCLARLARK